MWTGEWGLLLLDDRGEDTLEEVLDIMGELPLVMGMWSVDPAVQLGIH